MCIITNLLPLALLAIKCYSFVYIDILRWIFIQTHDHYIDTILFHYHIHERNFNVQ